MPRNLLLFVAGVAGVVVAVVSDACITNDADDVAGVACSSVLVVVADSEFVAEDIVASVVAVADDVPIDFVDEEYVVVVAVVVAEQRQMQQQQQLISDGGDNHQCCCCVVVVGGGGYCCYCSLKFLHC